MSDDYLIVKSDIPFGNVYAYRTGDQIHPDAVKQNKWEDYVATPGTKAAQEALGLPVSSPAPKKAAAKKTAAAKSTATTTPSAAAPQASGEDK